MKFDAVVGNPPYQVTANGEANGSDPIYHLFIDAGRAAGARGTFIHPGRFLFKAGKTPKDWNEKILNDEHFKVVRYWSNSGSIFPTVDIKGGVAVTYWDTKHTFKKIGVFTNYPELRSILDKVTCCDDFKSLSETIYTQTKYDLNKLYKDFPQYKSAIGSNGSDKRLRSNAFDKLDIFTEEPQDGYCAIHGLIRNKRVVRYFPTKYLELNPIFSKYKVLVPEANGSGAIGEVLSTPLIGKPLIGFTGSYIAIGQFTSIENANACMKYIKTKFARTLLGTLKVTQHNPSETWANVPLQDFTVSSDIDWSKSIAEIDQQLYAKYGLSAAEINFIETTIKPMR